MWNESDDLHCSTCDAVFLSHGRDRSMIVRLVRAKGWHIFEGNSIGGVPLSSHLCPKCVGSNRSRILPAALPTLEEDQFLF